MDAASAKGAKASNYKNIGTKENHLDEHGKYYFMEMNTRIQVEHPVTEMVTGIDLVKEQIRIASGERLSFGQDDIKFSGHAIECRINAEDPDNNFMPCPGKVAFFHTPGGPGVRIDSHVYQGYTIPPFYDSMIAKLITYGKNRSEALGIMQRALSEFTIEPIKTTIDFHKRLTADPAFLRGEVTTEFIEKMMAEKEAAQ